jgi:hypothetical protein
MRKTNGPTQKRICQVAGRKYEPIIVTGMKRIMGKQTNAMTFFMGGVFGGKILLGLLRKHPDCAWESFQHLPKSIAPNSVDGSVKISWIGTIQALPR